MTTTSTQTYNHVMVNGTRQALEQPMSQDQIREMLETYGIAKNLENAEAYEIEEGVLDFRVTRGSNG